MSWITARLDKKMQAVFRANMEKLKDKASAFAVDHTKKMWLKARTEILAPGNVPQDRLPHEFFMAGSDAAFEVFQDGKLVNHLREMKEAGLDQELEKAYQEEVVPNLGSKSQDYEGLYHQYFNAGFIHTIRNFKKYYARMRR